MEDTSGSSSSSCFFSSKGRGGASPVWETVVRASSRNCLRSLFVTETSRIGGDGVTGENFFIEVLEEGAN